MAPTLAQGTRAREEDEGEGDISKTIYVLRSSRSRSSRILSQGGQRGKAARTLLAVPPHQLPSTAQYTITLNTLCRESRGHVPLSRSKLSDCRHRLALTSLKGTKIDCPSCSGERANCLTLSDFPPYNPLLQWGNLNEAEPVTIAPCIKLMFE